MKQLVFLMCMLCFSSAKAAMIDVQLSGPEPRIGERVVVSISLIDVAEDFTSFFAGFKFDSNVFALAGTGIATDFTPFDELTGVGLDAFTITDDEVSFAFFEDFLMPTVFEAGSYLIASFELLVLAAAEDVTLEASLGGVFAAGSFESFADEAADSLTVTTEVSAPSIFALAGLGFMVLMLRRKA